MANSLPRLAGLNSQTFHQSAVHATPQLIDADVVLTDRDGNLANGTLTVSGLLPEDIVSIRNEGVGAGQIGFFAGIVTYQGVLIGQAFGGAGGTLAVVLNANASVEAVDALIENLTYANTADAPTASRTLTLNLTDGAGGLAAAAATDPFVGMDVGRDSVPSFGDLDGDGDLDALVGNGQDRLTYFQNTGTASEPVFAAGVLDPFGIPAVTFIAQPSLVDLDHDGDLDLVLASADGPSSSAYYVNTGTATAPLFTRTAGVLPITSILAERLAYSFGDLDGDGDLDLLFGDRHDGAFYYSENTGTATAPDFTPFGELNTFGITGIGADNFPRPTLGDVDGDGDLDLVSGDDSGNLLYYRNFGGAHAPDFAAVVVNPFGWFDVGEESAPTLADLDGDGDLDLIVGNSEGTLTFIETILVPSPPKITITLVNDAPQSGAVVLAAIAEDSGARVITQAELLSAVINPDGPPALARDLAITSGRGVLVDNHNGTWTYTPAANDDTDVLFSYVIDDGNAVAGTASLDITPVADQSDAAPEGAARNDFDGDGKADILWQNDNGTPAIWTMDGTNVVSGADVGPFNPGPAWKVIGSGDFNGDGKADILWQHNDGTVAEWLMDGAVLLAGASVAFNPGPSWHAKDAADFNGDGKADILWQNDDGAAAVWLMDGTTIAGGANVGPNVGSAWQVKSAGDFNGDGKADILWQNDDGAAAIWLMDGTTVLSGANVGPINPGPTWNAVAAADFNGDSKADILWQNDNGQVAIWEMDGFNFVEGHNVGPNVGPSWDVMGANDYNGDGRSDILWQNADGTPAIWLMDGFDLVSGTNVGPFNPGPSWHVIDQNSNLPI